MGLALGIFAQAARAEFGFSEPVTLAHVGNGDIVMADPAVAGDASGRFITVFRAYRSNGFGWWVTVYENGVWGEPKLIVSEQPQVNPPGPEARSASIATDNQGRWVAVCGAQQHFGPDFDIVALRSEDNGATWSTPILVNSGGSNDQLDDKTPVLKTDGAGRWMVAWRRGAIGSRFGSETELFYSMSSDNGASWIPQAPLQHGPNSEPGYDVTPQMDMNPNGAWIVVWTSTETLGGILGADSDALYVRSTDRGQTWSTPFPLNADATSDSFDNYAPAIAFSPDGVWLAQAGGLYRSTDDGATWTQVPTATPGGEILIPFGGGNWLRQIGRFTGASTDDGLTWVDSVIGAPTSGLYHSFSMFAMATSAGKMMQMCNATISFGTSQHNLRARMMNHFPLDLDAGPWRAGPERISLSRSILTQIIEVENEGLATWPEGSVSLRVAPDPCGLFPAGLDIITTSSLARPGEFLRFFAELTVPPLVGQCSANFEVIHETAGVFANVQVPFEFYGYKAELVSTNLPDPLQPGAAFGLQITLHNTGDLTWTPELVDLEVAADTCGMAQSPRAVLTGSVARDATGVFNIPIQAPANPNACSLIVRPRFRHWVPNVTRSGYFEGSFSIIAPVSLDYAEFALQDNESGWTGASILGSGLTGANSSGVCLYAPEQGDNMVAWISPSGAVPLVDRRVSRVRIEAASTQSLPDAIPLWDVTYDNFYPSGFGSTYGGQTWFLDVAGGALGVSRPEGRTSFDIYAAPNAMLTAQWRGTIGGGSVGSNGGAFAPEADAYNDMRLAVRLLDFGSAALNANADFGTICVSRVRVDSMDYDTLAGAGTLWAPAISSATHAAQTLAQEAEGAGMATIVEGVAAIYQLTPSGPGSRKTLIPLDASQTGLPSLYPVLWETDQVYRGTSHIQSMVNGGVGQEGSDPVDTVFMNFDTPTNEIGAINFTTRGSFNNMQFAASPRLGATAGGPQPYVAFFAGNNRTLSDLPDAARLRMMTEFFNVPEIAPEGQGADPLAVLWSVVDRVQPAL